MVNYKIGDRVVVTHSGARYTTYNEKYKEMGFKFPKHDHYNGKDGDKGTIFSVGWHESDSVQIYGVNLDLSGLQMLIGERGISKLTTMEKYTDYVVISENYDQAVEITKHQKEVCDSASNPYCEKTYYRINPSYHHRYNNSSTHYKEYYSPLPILTYNQWKEMITDKPLNMNKKIIEYKIIKKFPGLTKKFYESPTPQGYHFKVGGGDWECYKDSLDSYEYFEPVYEQEKGYVDIEIGNPVKTIRITRHGYYKVQGKGAQQVSHLKDFVKNHEGGNDAYFPYKWSIKTLWIGCEEEGTLVTIEDIQKVIDTYEKEFGNK